MELKVICKRLITQNLDENITEGEYGADIIGITVPRMYGEHDLSTFSFRLTAVSKLNESVAEQVLTMDSAGEENIHLLWEVTSDFTASSGEVTLILAGVNPDNTVQIKFTSQPVTINDDSRLEFIESPTILEQAYNQVQLEVQKAVDAAERAEEAADRPIKLPLATTNEAGCVIPDGTSITVDKNGVISCTSSIEGSSMNIEFESYSKITDSVEYPFISLELYGSSTQNGDPTVEAPVDIANVGDNESISIMSCGKNLFPWNDYTTAPFQQNALTSWEMTSDVINVVPDAAKVASGFCIWNSQVNKNFYACDGKTITLSCEVWAESETALRIGIENIKLQKFTVGNAWQKCSVTLDFMLSTSGKTIAWYANYSDVPFKVRNIQVEIGSVATDYEPYKGNTAEITTGLPLCSVGDVRDELFLNTDTWTIIKRTAKLDSYAGETITTDYISSTGGLDTGAEVVYALDESYRITLSASEIAALNKLQTYKGLTHIANSSNAVIEMEYCINPLLGKYVYPVIKRYMA